MTDLTCVELVELASGHLDRDLPSKTEESVEAHLQGCPGCADFVHQLAATAGALRRLGGPRT